MLYKINKDGFVVNEAAFEKIQPYYREILKEIENIYIEKFGDDLLSIYVRGSVSVGRAKPGISDVDSVAVIKKELPKEKLIWIVKVSKELTEKYPKAGFVELCIVSLEELLTSKQYKNLRVYLKVQSVCLWGEHIADRLPEAKPGRQLAQKLYGDLDEELAILKNIFAGKIKDREYLFEKRPISFWCIWMTRVLLRAGLGIIMAEEPVYSQDLKTCFAVFTKKYPQYKKEMRQLLKWSVDPEIDAAKIHDFLDKFAPKFLELWQKNINNN